MSSYILQPGDILPTEKFVVISSASDSFSYISYEDLDAKSIGEYLPIPIGSVEYVQKYFEVMNITCPKPINYPKSLQKYLNRNVWSSVFGEVEDHLFVKPKENKSFTGDIKSELELEIHSDTSVWVSDPVEFTSEFRFYVLENKILGYSQYDDGPNDTIDVSKVNQIVQDYKDSPIGYSLDVGHTKDADLLLVEVNDGWSLGYYPWGTCSKDSYLNLIENRWQEITIPYRLRKD